MHYKRITCYLFKTFNLYSHPKKFWGFYGFRLNLYRKIVPNNGFYILKQFAEKTTIKDYFIVTSNVDGHFQKAGFPNDKILEIHGSIHNLQCNKCCSITDAKGITNNLFVKKGRL